MTRTQFVLIALVIVAFLGLTWYANGTPKTEKSPIQTSIDSLREAREKQAKIENEISKSVWEKCYQESLTLSGKVFDDQQGIAYKCWTSEKNKIINGTGNLTPVSEVPKRGITLIPVSHATSGLKKNQTPHIKSVQNVKKTDEKKYWKAYETAIAQIQKWEGLRLTAYWDHRGYSIGYGSRAKSSTERITKSEADRRLVSIVKPLLAKVQKDFPTLHPEAQGALVSFAYNCHKGYESVRKNGLKYHGSWCKTAGKKVLPGLVSRRNEEWKLISGN